MSFRFFRIIVVTGVLARMACADPGGPGLKDVLIQRAIIPSPQNRHGEVRLIRRGDAHGVQTFLYSASLKRGLKAIRNREIATWPAASPYHADSERYLDLLDRAEAAVFAAEPDADGLRRMLIEIVATADVASVEVYAPELRGEGDDIEITGGRLLARETVHPDYARRAMDIIMTASFAPDQVEP